MGKLSLQIEVRLAMNHLSMRDLIQSATVCREWRDASEAILWSKMLEIGGFTSVPDAIRHTLAGPFGTAALNYDSIERRFVPLFELDQESPNKSRLCRWPTLQDAQTTHQRPTHVHSFDSCAAFRLANGDLVNVFVASLHTDDTFTLGLETPAVTAAHITADWLQSQGSHDAALGFFDSVAAAYAAMASKYADETKYDVENLYDTSFGKRWSLPEFMVRRAVLRALCMRLFGGVANVGESALLDAVAVRYPYMQHLRWIAENTTLQPTSDACGNTVTPLLNRWLLCNCASNWMFKTAARLDVYETNELFHVELRIARVPITSDVTRAAHPPLYAATAHTHAELFHELDSLVPFFVALLSHEVVGGFGARPAEIEDGVSEIVSIADATHELVDMSPSTSHIGRFSGAFFVKSPPQLARFAANEQQPSLPPTLLPMFQQRQQELSGRLSERVACPGDAASLIDAVVFGAEHISKNGVLFDASVSSWSASRCQEWLASIGAVRQVSAGADEQPIDGASMHTLVQNDLLRAGIGLASARAVCLALRSVSSTQKRALHTALCDFVDRGITWMLAQCGFAPTLHFDALRLALGMRLMALAPFEELLVARLESALHNKPTTKLAHRRLKRSLAENGFFIAN